MVIGEHCKKYGVVHDFHLCVKVINAKLNFLSVVFIFKCQLIWFTFCKRIINGCNLADKNIYPAQTSTSNIQFL